MMLQRNLLRGVTRAKKLVVLAGSRRALAAAVRTRGARHLALAHRLHPHPQPIPETGEHWADSALRHALPHLSIHLDGLVLLATDRPGNGRPISDSA